jgi:hypothetical protein
MADLPVGVDDKTLAAGVADVDTRVVGSVVQQRVVPVDVIAPSACVRVAIAGIGGRPSVAPSIGPNNLFTVWNGSPSNMMELAKVHVEYSPPTASSAAMGTPVQPPIMAVAYKLTAVPSSGVDITPAKFVAHPSQTSHASVVVRTDGQARAHGTIAASALIASIGANASAPIGQAMLPRPQGLASLNNSFQYLSPDQDIVGDRDPIYPVIIGPGQGFVVRLENLVNPSAANPSTAMYAGEIAWREYDPTI